MSHVITKRATVSRRKLLKGFTLTGGAWIGLPPLVSMFNSTGTAYAAERAATGKVAEAPIENRFVLWFNGNGIPERYWIPAETGSGYSLTPCLAPLAPFRDDIHPLQNFRRQGNDLQKFLLTQLARHRTEYACPNRFAAFIDKHRGVRVEADIR